MLAVNAYQVVPECSTVGMDASYNENAQVQRPG